MTDATAPTEPPTSGAGPTEPTEPTAWSTSEAEPGDVDLIPCGALGIRPDSTIVRANATLAAWLGRSRADLVDRVRFTDLLDAGSRIYFETNVWPLLLLQDEVHDAALVMLRSDHEPLSVLVNARLRRDQIGDPTGIDLAVFDATGRERYQHELHRARRAAEADASRAHEVALTLQRSLMAGTIEQGPAFRVETRYEPAVDTLEIGGDWYDAFVLDGGRTVGISVGDVVGKGISAACAMGQVRSALRALAGTGAGPSGVLGQLDGFVRGIPDALCTSVVYAEIDVATGAFRFACAGHPPPLVRRRSGEAELLWDGRSPPLGVAVRTRPEAAGSLGVGDRLVLFTDGLVERRTRTLDDGLAALVRDASRPGSAASVDELVESAAASQDPAHDDVCVLAFELLDPPSTPTDGS